MQAAGQGWLLGHRSQLPASGRALRWKVESCHGVELGLRFLVAMVTLPAPQAGLGWWKGREQGLLRCQACPKRPSSVPSLQPCRLPAWAGSPPSRAPPALVLLPGCGRGWWQEHMGLLCCPRPALGTWVWCVGLSAFLSPHTPLPCPIAASLHLMSQWALRVSRSPVPAQWQETSNGHVCCSGSGLAPALPTLEWT